MKSLLLMVVIAVSFKGYSQLANGSIAPDFTLTDEDGRRTIYTLS